MEKQHNQNQNHHHTDKKHHHHHHHHHRRRHQPWGTWEDLLLASAVKRHGSDDWDAVATEIQNRTNLPHLLTTARNCEQKFLDLKRRFADQCNDAVSDSPETAAPAAADVDHVPWLDELRKLRVAELRQEVQRYDVSILSLQLKVKRLEEEREENVKENDGERDAKPDLENSGKPENDEKSGEREDEPEPANSEPDRNDINNNNNNSNTNNNINKLPTGDESDREENQSVNESNSTGSRSVGGGEDVKQEPPPVQTGPKEPDPKVEDSSELAHSEGGTRESSEVQSSASLTRKRKTRLRKKVSGSEESPANDEAAVKSQPLIGLLELIKGYKNSSLFERRLESQESDYYKSCIKEHLDLETIQTRLRNGSYSSDPFGIFRDLILLFTNVVSLFPSDSDEARAADKLRRLVNSEIKNHIPTRQPDPTPQPPSSSSQQAKLESSPLLSKQKPAAPILVCRKRTSISAKPSTFGQRGSGDQITSSERKSASDSKPPGHQKPPSSVSDDDDSDEDPPRRPPPPPQQPVKEKEKPVTGARSLRRSNKNLAVSNPSKKIQSSSSTPKASSPKSDHKTKAAAAEAPVSDKKRSAAADFLKRIKRNGPVESLRSSGGGGGGSGSRSGGGKEQKKVVSGSSGGKGEKGKERVLRNSDKKNESIDNNNKRSVGRPPKKTVETNATPSKRGRESSSNGKDKRPKKRTRK